MKQSFTPLVTIAIPAYKRAYLADSIQSALSQDYENIEVIVVDDHSPQNLYEVVSPFFVDSRLSYHCNDKNLGQESIVLNWNKCLEYAKGDFFILLCDDDILLPTFVSELLNLSEKYPSCNVFHARKWNLHQNGVKEESLVWPEYEDGESFLKNRLAKKRHHTITEFMYRTKSIKDQGYVVFPSGFYSDTASIIKLALNAGIVSSSKCLALFRFNDEHITSSYTPKNCLDKFIAATQYWKWIHQYPTSSEYEKEIKDGVEWVVVSSINAAPLTMKIRMLIEVNNSILSFKQKVALLLDLCFK